MSNTRNIEPKTIWTASGDKVATILSLTNFFDYHFDDGGGMVSYVLSGFEGDPQSVVSYFVGNLPIPSDIIQQWGASDDIIFDYVALQLGLVIVNV
jgi:hypothetical protein